MPSNHPKNQKRKDKKKKGKMPLETAASTSKINQSLSLCDVLPIEVIDYTATYLTDDKDIRNFAEVCHTFNSVVHKKRLKQQKAAQENRLQELSKGPRIWPHFFTGFSAMFGADAGTVVPTAIAYHNGDISSDVEGLLLSLVPSLPAPLLGIAFGFLTYGIACWHNAKLISEEQTKLNNTQSQLDALEPKSEEPVPSSSTENSNNREGANVDETNKDVEMTTYGEGHDDPEGRDEVAISIRPY